VVVGGNGDAFTQSYTTNGDVRIGFYSLGLYFQDEYRVTPNLKLTLALRGDRNSNPICSQDCYSRLETPFSGITHDINTPYNQAISTNLHSAFPNVEKVALQPRIGFTWSPMGRSSTVLRGGIGVFSDLYQGVLMDEMIGNSPLTNTFTVKPAGSCVAGMPCTGAALAPTALGSVAQLGANSNASFLSAFSGGGTLSSILLSNPFFTPPNFVSISNQINNPKYLEWNFEIQQAIGSKMSLNIDYVGTHGYDNLIQNANLNAANETGLFGTAVPFGQLPAAFNSCTITNPLTCSTNPGQALAGTDPRFGIVRELQSVGSSNYDGLVTTFTRKFSHGFQGSLNWTWSHALDELTSTNPGTPFNVFQSVVYQINPNCLRCQNYSNADSDARHNLTANYVWELPFKSSNRLLNETIGGWTVAGTFFAHTGLPYTPQGLQTGVGFNDGLLGIPLIPADQIGAASISCSASAAGSFGQGVAGQCVSPNSFSASNFGGGVNQADYGVRRNTFRGPGYFDSDLNVNKNFPVTERVSFELGGSFFNVFNHPNFGLPNPYTFNSQFGQLCVGPFGCTGMAVQPATPYGSFQGAGVEGRLIQVHGKITF
jgi:hypothetical protein